MAGDKYISRTAGKNKEVAGQQTSAGVGDANKIPALDSTGKFDISLMPVGVGAEVKICAAFENLVAGDFVNLFLSGGVIQAQKADATGATKGAHGFVIANVTAPANATVYLLSTINAYVVATLTIGSDYYLSTTPGGVLISPGPVAAGNLNQYLGRATGANELLFEGPISAAVEMS